MLKLRRAEKHLDLIVKAELRLRKSPQCAIVPKIRPDLDFIDYALQLPVPSQSIGPILGDCLHNLRCVLDHIIYALAEFTAMTNNISRSDKDRRASMFPICLCPAGNFSKFDEQVSRGRLNNICPAARAIIRGLQPKDDRDLLWILSELENIDKHRNISTAIMTATHLDIETGGGGRVFVASPIVPYRSGATIWEEAVNVGIREMTPETRTATIEAKMKVQLQAATFIAFEEAPALNLGVTSIVQDILQRVRDHIIPVLEPFFN